MTLCWCELMELHFERLGTLPSEDLAAARLLAHWAVQIPAALANHHVPARDDDSQSNLGWVGDQAGCWLSRPLTELPGEASGVSVGVRPLGLELLLFEADGGVWERLPLEGQSLQSALAWTRSNLETRAGSALEVTRLRDYPMPPHPVLERGVPFEIGRLGPALGELAAWFAAFTGLFSRLEPAWLGRGELSSVAEARVWPHHFDLGGLLTVAQEYTDGGVEQIGFGFAPGDEHYEQPYLYVTPYPQPELPPVTGLPCGGFWKLDGFVGAILGGDRILALPAEGREAASEAFLEGAIQALLPD